MGRDGSRHGVQYQVFADRFPPLFAASPPLDGRIAPPPGHHTTREPYWITSEAARAAVQPLRWQADAALTGVDHPLPFAELRARCRVRTATLYERLAALTAAGRLGKSDQGYCLAGC